MYSWDITFFVLNNGLFDRLCCSLEKGTRLVLFFLEAVERFDLLNGFTT